MGGRRILIVDDNRDAAVGLQMMLGLAGFEVAIAFDGVGALATGEMFAPDLVLLDLGLPVMDGFEIAREIRVRPWGKHVPIVALTGWGQTLDRQRTREAGFAEHLTKPPPRAAELTRILDRVIDDGQ